MTVIYEGRWWYMFSQIRFAEKGETIVFPILDKKMFYLMKWKEQPEFEYEFKVVNKHELAKIVIQEGGVDLASKFHCIYGIEFDVEDVYRTLKEQGRYSHERIVEDIAYLYNFYDEDVEEIIEELES